MDRSDAQRPAPSGLRAPGRLPASERAQLLDEYRAGQQVADLAERYRVNSVTLYRWLLAQPHALPALPHTTPRQLPDRVMAQLVQRYGDGEDAQVLAAEHGLNPSTLARYANDRGVTRRSSAPALS